MRWWYAPVFLAALVIFVVTIAPMRALAPQAMGAFTFADVHGTIWRARFDGMALGPYIAETADWRLSLVDLIQGRVVADVAMHGKDLRGNIRLLANARGDRRIIARSIEARGLALGRYVTQTGMTRADDLDILFQSGRCVWARGTIRSDALALSRAQFGGFGPMLQGRAQCNGAVADVSLQGSDMGASIALIMTLKSDGAASWTSTVDGEAGPMQAAIRSVGFTGEPGRPLTSRGETQWLPF